MSEPVKIAKLVDNPKKPYKALAGFVTAFVSALVVGLQGQDIDTLTSQDWTRIVVGALVVTGGVYFARNPKVSKFEKVK